MNTNNNQNRASYQFAEGRLDHAIQVKYLDERYEHDQLDDNIIDYLANAGETYGTFEGNELFL